MVLGFRIVKGQDSAKSDEHDEEHTVGTITAVKVDNSVEVTWDTGQVTECHGGKDGKYDLKVFDSGPQGIRHKAIRCEGCDDRQVTGTRWRCCICDDVSLCTPCYHDDCHDTSHPFERIDFPGSAGVKVEKRSASQRYRAMGLYPDAKVTRGPHWEHEDQDGGEGSLGVVVDYTDSSHRSIVTVRWQKSDNTCDYRVGHQGKVDLCCHQAAPGADYYYEHLANVDVARYLQWRDEVVDLKVGDRVFVDRPLSELREWLQARGDWTGGMEEAVGLKPFVGELLKRRNRSSHSL